MRYLGRPVLALVATLTIVLAAECATAAAQPTDPALFEYVVGDIPANQNVSVSFTSQVRATVGDGEVLSGSIASLVFGTTSFQVSSAGPGPLSGIFHQSLLVDGQFVTGTATVPAGTLAMLKNRLTGKSVILRGGNFSIATGALPPKVMSVTCKGTSTSCTATVPTPVGTPNRKLVIKLSHPNLHLESIAALPGSTFGKQLLGRGHLSGNGSEYVIALKQYSGQAKDAKLVFKFSRM